MDFLEKYAISGQRSRHFAAVESMGPIEFRKYCKDERERARDRVLRLKERYGVRHIDETKHSLTKSPRSTADNFVMYDSRAAMGRKVRITNMMVVLKDAPLTILVPCSQRLSILSEETSLRVFRFLEEKSLAAMAAVSKSTMLLSIENTLWRAICCRKKSLGATYFGVSDKGVQNWRMEMKWRMDKRTAADKWRRNYAQGRVGRRKPLVRPWQEPGFDMYALRNVQIEVPQSYTYSCSFRKDDDTTESGVIAPSQGAGIPR